MLELLELLIYQYLDSQIYDTNLQELLLNQPE